MNADSKIAVRWQLYQGDELIAAHTTQVSRASLKAARRPETMAKRALRAWLRQNGWQWGSRCQVALTVHIEAPLRVAGDYPVRAGITYHV